MAKAKARQHRLRLQPDCHADGMFTRLNARSGTPVSNGCIAALLASAPQGQNKKLRPEVFPYQISQVVPQFALQASGESNPECFG